MNRKIAIIGMGASGTLVLRELSEALSGSDSVEILLFEMQNEIGPGIPYSTSSSDDAFLINMRSFQMSLDKNNPLKI